MQFDKKCYSYLKEAVLKNENEASQHTVNITLDLKVNEECYAKEEETFFINAGGMAKYIPIEYIRKNKWVYRDIITKLIFDSNPLRVGDGGSSTMYLNTKANENLPRLELSITLPDHITKYDVYKALRPMLRDPKNPKLNMACIYVTNLDVWDDKGSVLDEPAEKMFGGMLNAI